MKFEEVLHSGGLYKRPKWDFWAKTVLGQPSYCGADDIFVVNVGTGMDISITNADKKAKDWVLFEEKTKVATVGGEVTLGPIMSEEFKQNTTRTMEFVEHASVLAMVRYVEPQDLIDAIEKVLSKGFVPHEEIK